MKERRQNKEQLKVIQDGQRRLEEVRTQWEQGGIDNDEFDVLLDDIRRQCGIEPIAMEMRTNS